jgi:hypothetical protein
LLNATGLIHAHADNRQLHRQVLFELTAEQCLICNRFGCSRALYDFDEVIDMFRWLSALTRRLRELDGDTGGDGPFDALCGCGHPKYDHPDGLDCLHIGRDVFDGCMQHCRVFVESRKCA